MGPVKPQPLADVLDGSSVPAQKKTVPKKALVVGAGLLVLAGGAVAHLDELQKGFRDGIKWVTGAKPPEHLSTDEETIRSLRQAAVEEGDPKAREEAGKKFVLEYSKQQYALLQKKMKEDQQPGANALAVEASNLLDLGKYAFDRGEDLDLAEKHANDALKIPDQPWSKHSADAHQLLGRIKMSRDRAHQGEPKEYLQKAIQSFDAAAKLNPDSVFSRALADSCQRKLGGPPSLMRCTEQQLVAELAVINSLEVPKQNAFKDGKGVLDRGDNVQLNRDFVLDMKRREEKKVLEDLLEALRKENQQPPRVVQNP